MNTNTVWDKTNIGENYPGVTSPLTYSFVVNAYKSVYPRFLAMVGVNEKDLEENSVVFDNMLGYINGQIYYNINNWYELVKLLPGYKYNKGYFENMLRPVANKNETDQKYDVGSIIANRKLVFGFLKRIVFIKESYRKFDIGYGNAVGEAKNINVKELNNFEIVSKFKDLQEKFFDVWAYTIVNDFRVMVYYGVLTKYINKRIPNEFRSDLENLVGGKLKPYSIKPLNELIKIANAVRSKRLSSVSLDNVMQDRKLAKLIKDYLEEFGTRAFNELKLEDKTFIDEPQLLVSLIEQYVQMEPKELESITNNSRCSNDALERTLKALSFVERPLFKYLYHTSIDSIHKREEFRLKRGNVFNIANDFFKEMAKRFVQEDLIESSDDIYYLYTDEVFGIMSNHRLKESFKGIIKDRKKILKKHSKSPLPRRIKSKRIYQIVDENTRGKKVFDMQITSMGKVKGAKVVIMPELDLTKDVKNKVLVTHATDPGWTVLFPLLKGVIIQTGGMLSHASIVAREIGIPCVVVPNALSILKDGDLIDIYPDKKQIKILS